MPFLEILKDLVERVDGAVGAAIMGPDGLAVEKYLGGGGGGGEGGGGEGGGYDIEAAGVEYGKVVEEALKAAKVLNLGALEEITVGAGDSTVILRMAAPQYGYYIVLAMKAGSNVGRARYLLRKAALKARKEF